MEDSNPQEIITYLHVGFLDRCASHYTNLPYIPCRDCAGAFIQDKRAVSYGLQLPKKGGTHAKNHGGGSSRDRT